ncbi:hypothetical protein JD844_023286 [Phrynosoma platyrhinos]|uniref:Uncharacterized protein n=1 Tax=Phrynosoma platyrhinos TaxID=52577 RepID=A0ABQ7SWD7_PHRPL|nr:hypothetical protein JD844_023286 [Phrynosoma platyrhinos]
MTENTGSLQMVQSVWNVILNVRRWKTTRSHVGDWDQTIAPNAPILKMAPIVWKSVLMVYKGQTASFSNMLMKTVNATLAIQTVLKGVEVPLVMTAFTIRGHASPLYYNMLGPGNHANQCGQLETG